MTNQKSIIIYRDKLLSYSETFIPAQAECLTSYEVIYTGIEKTEEIKPLIDSNKIITLSDITPNFLAWKKAFRLFALINSKWLTALKNLSPCLIHCHFGTDGFWAAKLAHQLKIPLIVTVHGYDITKQRSALDRFKNSELKQKKKFFQGIANAWNDFLARLIYELPLNNSQIPNWLMPNYVTSKQRQIELVFKEADCIIAVSQFISSKLIENGCPPEKIKVHYIGVDVDKFQPDPNIKREPIVLFVGRLVEKKGCEYLIRAMAQIQKIKPDVKLVIIGDGDLRPTLEKLAADLLSNYIFLGVQTPEQVKAWMNKASIFSVPSVIARSGDAEAFGMVFAEAQAMGLPVVSFASGGIPEAVIHEQTGFLAPEKDVETLAKYIINLLQDERLRENFAIEGRNLMVTKFNLKQQTLKLEKIYDELL
ncbi:MAG: glycosyltransferase [Xenococcaceae cyanobacterium]